MRVCCKVNIHMMSKKILEVDIDRISVNPYQPRRHFCRDELEELAQSIRTIGVIQPPVVRPLDSQEEQYEIISGERRFRAAQMAGLKTLSVLVSSHDNDYSAEAALIENIQRVDLNPIEISRALQRLMKEFDFRQEDLAERVAKPRSTITNYLRLLTLPKQIQQSLESARISMGHAKAILSVKGFEKQLFLHRQVLEEDLSVRETEQFVQKMEKSPKKKLERIFSKDCHLQDLQEKLQQALGTKVVIQGSGKKGRISIDYYNLDDLDRILEKLGEGG